MLKKFFISMLGSMAAIWLSLGLLFIGSIVAIGIMIGKSASTSSTSGNKILHIVLKGTINDSETELSLTDLISSTEIATENLNSIIKALETAKTDKSVKGVFIDCQGAAMGIASRTELIEAINNFKEDGSKWVYAYADNFDQGDYYVATAADKIFLNPVGALNVHGLSSQVMFYPNVMKKLGIDVQVVRVGSFKSAVEPFMRMDMSPESRLQTEEFLTGIWSSMKKIISENRSNMTEASIDAMADSLSFTWAPERYVSTKAVDDLCYRHEVENRMRERLKKDKDDEMPYITPSEYLTSKGVDIFSGKGDHIALLFAEGDIVDSGEGGIVSETLVPEILRLANDDHVKGLVLRVNSPGGSAFASEQIWKALEEFKATKKPYYVSMGDYAASGGYYISCGADKIYCDASTLTGSIGIFGVIPNASDLLRNKIGLGVETIETNTDANFPTLIDPLTPAQLDGMQQYVNRGYETFVKRVSEGRKISVDSVKMIGGGRVWDGMAAKRIGLVDEIGSLNKAINDMRENLSSPKRHPVVAYPEPKISIFTTLLRNTMSGKTIEIPGYTATQAEALIRRALRTRYTSPLQARMPIILVN